MNFKRFLVVTYIVNLITLMTGSLTFLLLLITVMSIYQTKADSKIYYGKREPNEGINIHNSNYNSNLNQHISTFKLFIFDI